MPAKYEVSSPCGSKAIATDKVFATDKQSDIQTNRQTDKTFDPGYKKSNMGDDIGGGDVAHWVSLLVD